MLQLPGHIVDQIIEHAYEEHPIEAVGVVVGRGSEHLRWIPLRNVAGSTEFYEADPAVLLLLSHQLEDSGDEIVAVVHSHTRTAPVPSKTDIELAFEPNAHYLVVSTRHKQPELRAYRIQDGHASEVPFERLADS